MVERPRIEPIEVEVVQLSYVPGPRVDRVGSARRWWDATSPATARVPTAWPAPTEGKAATGGTPTTTGTAPPAGTVATTVLTGNTSFWRIVDVPGDQLGRVLGCWWLRSRHDDGRLSLEEPHIVDGAWQLAGSLRMAPLTKRFGIDVHLSPYARFWSMLELTPRCRIRPSRLYFRVGHDSLDHFIARLCALA